MSDAIAAAMPELKTWLGRSRRVEELIALPMVRRIAGMLDLDPDAFGVGTPLPGEKLGAGRSALGRLAKQWGEFRGLGKTPFALASA